MRNIFQVINSVLKAKKAYAERLLLHKLVEQKQAMLKYIALLDDEHILNNYDDVRAFCQMNTVELNSIKEIYILNDFTSKNVFEEINSIEGVFNEIRTKVFILGEEQRRGILERLETLNMNVNPSKEEMLNVMKWILEYVDGILGQENDITKTFFESDIGYVRGQFSFYGISSRQSNAFHLCLDNANRKDAYEAYEALNEFVNNYSYNKKEPLSNFEKICIKEMSKAIINALNN